MVSQRVMLCVFLVMISIISTGVYAETFQDWLNKGHNLMNQKDYTGAIDAFDHAIELQQSNALAWYGKAYCYFYLHMKDECLSTIDQAIKVCCNDMSGDRNDAWLLWNFKIADCASVHDWQGGIDIVNQMIELYPEAPDSQKSQMWENKAVFYKNMHQYNEAIYAYGKALQYYPKNYKNWKVMGELLGQVGNMDESLKSFYKAKEYCELFYQTYPDRDIQNNGKSAKELDLLLIQGCIDNTDDYIKSHAISSTNQIENNNLGTNSPVPSNVQNQMPNSQNTQGKRDNIVETSSNPDSSDSCCARVADLIDRMESFDPAAYGCTYEELDACAHARGKIN